jgi:hypothetical protein
LPSVIGGPVSVFIAVQSAAANWPGNPRALITRAERRFPVRIRIAAPPKVSANSTAE